MIDRYSRPEMAELWSEKKKFETWLEVEITFVEVMETLGRFPKGVSARIRKNASFDIRQIERREKTIKHDVIAFLSEVSSRLGDDGRYLHWGMTSSDLLDTALAVLLKQAGDRILQELDRLRGILRELALRYKHTPMIGRSHGVHAEPITFGLKLLVWHEELGRAGRRLEAALEDACVGKLSGAVGTFSYLDPEVEEQLCARLGIGFAPASTQIVQRDRVGALLLALALMGSSLEKIATEIRHLQRTEVLEVEEPFTEGQRGSSAMPHKKNPVASERVAGLARLLRGYALAAMENVNLWHERDISHSSVERVIIPDGFAVADFMLDSLSGILEGLVVREENMSKNIYLTRGLVFSQKLLLLLTQKGIGRDEAYASVQKCAMEVWKGRSDFVDLVRRDPAIAGALTPEEIDGCFDLAGHLRNVDRIFDRVLRK